METRSVLTGLALSACASFGASAALADSEASSMAGSFNEGAHSSFAEQNLGGPTLWGNNSESGGVFGISGSSLSSGPRSSTASTESGGAGQIQASSVSGGPMLNETSSQSGMHTLWNSLSYGTAGNTADAGGANEPAEQTATLHPTVKAHVSSVAVRTYHWPRHAVNSYYAYRARPNM